MQPEAAQDNWFEIVIRNSIAVLHGDLKCLRNDVTTRLSNCKVPYKSEIRSKSACTHAPITLTLKPLISA